MKEEKTVSIFLIAAIIAGCLLFIIICVRYCCFSRNSNKSKIMAAIKEEEMVVRNEA